MKRSIEGSVYKSKERKGWIARLRYTDTDGVQREKKRICITHAIAKDKIKQLRAEVETLNSDRKTYRQLDEFFREKYLHKARFIDGKKLSGFRQPLNIIAWYLDFALDHFGDQYLDEISYSDLQRYKELIVNLPTKHGSQRSVADTNQFLRRLRRHFTIAVQQGWLMANPFNRGESMISDSFEVERTRILSSEEEARLLEACDRHRRHLKPVIIFAIETACRKNEILNLKWSSVNLPGRFIKVESGNTKSLKSRLVPVSDRLLDVLVDVRETAWLNSIPEPDSLVFTTGDFKKAFNGACAEAGILDLNFHDLRHTGITRLLEAGISPPLVMKISGHTQQKTFLRYVNQSESSIYDIAMRLGRAA